MKVRAAQLKMQNPSLPLPMIGFLDSDGEVDPNGSTSSLLHSAIRTAQAPHALPSSSNSNGGSLAVNYTINPHGNRGRQRLRARRGVAPERPGRNAHHDERRLPIAGVAEQPKAATGQPRCGNTPSRGSRRDDGLRVGRRGRGHVSNISAGAFEGSFTADAAGDWSWQWIGTGEVAALSEPVTTTAIATCPLRIEGTACPIRCAGGPLR